MVGFSGTMNRLPVAADPGIPSRPAAQRSPFQVSALLVLAAILLPLALVPLGRLLPTPASEADRLAQDAALVAERVAALLTDQAAALPGPTEGRAPPADRVAPALRAALTGADLPPGLRIALLDAEARVLAEHHGGTPRATARFLAAEQPVPGWPLHVMATRDAAMPAGDGLLPLGAAMLALLLLAGMAHLRERRAQAAAAAEERREAQRSARLAESAARLRLALSAAELGCWSWDEAADEATWDLQAAAILGWHPAGSVRAAALRARFDPADLPALDAAIGRARLGGDPAQCALRLRPQPGRGVRWIELRAQASEGPQGTLWHGVVADMTARRETEEQQQRLLREVDHRAKNALAVVQALLRLTRAEDQPGFLPRIQARIAALARAHTLLAQSRWQGAGLHSLATLELQRIRRAGPAVPPVLSGPAILLSPVAAQPMAMVLHELASNAAQYGALAQPDGTLSLTWRLEPDGGLEITWQERRGGGAPLPGRMRSGFGTRILDATVQDQLGGRIRRDWLPEGLRCVLNLPAGCVLAASLPAAA